MAIDRGYKCPECPATRPTDMSAPSPDTPNSSAINDTIGNKADTHVGTSIMAFEKRSDEHEHAVSRCYPTLADGISLNCGVGDWELGAPVDIIPINTITSDYDLHYVFIEDIANLEVTHEIHFFKISDDSFVGSLRARLSDKKSAADSGPFQSEIIPANEGIYARAAVEGGNGGSTITISFRYHTY